MEGKRLTVTDLVRAEHQQFEAQLAKAYEAAEGLLAESAGPWTYAELIGEIAARAQVEIVSARWAGDELIGELRVKRVGREFVRASD